MCGNQKQEICNKPALQVMIVAVLIERLGGGQQIVAFPVFKNNERIPSLYKERRSYIKVMSKTVKRIWNWFTTVLVAVVVILALLLVGARLIGLQVFNVLSGSMEPTYHVGSLIYVKDVDPFELESGDVITFMLDEDTVATHRVVEVVPDESDSTVVRFKTKGDANEAEDGSLVHYKNVIGSPVFTIPKLGYVANYIQNPPGTYIAISAGAILLLLVFLPDLFGSDDEEKKQKKKQGKFEQPRNSQ